MSVTPEVDAPDDRSARWQSRFKDFLLISSFKGRGPWEYRLEASAAVTLRQAERLTCSAMDFLRTSTDVPQATSTVCSMLTSAIRLLEHSVAFAERDQFMTELRERLGEDATSGWGGEGDAEVAEASRARMCEVAEGILRTTNELVTSRRGFWPRGAIRLALAASLLGVFVFLATLGLKTALGPRDLLQGSHLTTSSNYLYWPVLDMRFHTDNDRSPWAQFRLEQPRRIRRFVIENTREFRNRALPLVIELSGDGKSFIEVARREQPFRIWRPHIEPTHARYVRVRVDRKSWLHLKSVEAY